jgi:hypothetical protein
VRRKIICSQEFCVLARYVKSKDVCGGIFKVFFI